MSPTPAEALLQFLRLYGHSGPKPILWVGAGASVPSGYPTLAKLEALLKEHLPQTTATGFDFIDEFLAEHSEAALLNQLETHLGAPKPFNDIHRAMAKLVGANMLRAVFTTNYDELIEDALKAAKIHYIPQTLEQNFRLAGRLEIWVLKLHGSRSNWKQAILSAASYAGFEASFPLLRAQLDLNLKQHPLLFVGCSMQDERLLGWLRNQTEAERKALFGGRVVITQRDWEALNKRHQKLYESANIKPILLSGYDEIPKVLMDAAEALSQPVVPGAVERAGEALDDIDAYVQRYQAEMQRHFERFQMPGDKRSGVNPVDLDEMYVPLRLDEDLDWNRLDAGREIGAKDLLEPGTRLILTGVAGAGKTTWMKYTFRKLLRTDKALPFFIELRDMAKVLSGLENKGGQLTLRQYMVRTLSGTPLERTARQLDKLLRNPNVRPVLLIDGWDELGELGNRLRDDLMGLLQAFPRINVAATSRPYGESRPSRVEEFHTLQIQPLSDEEIGLLGERFFSLVYGQESKEVQRGLKQFWEALSASPEAKSLARTPLLLVMMLGLSRDQTLPDRRHELYQRCLEDLLTARVDVKERDGARLHDDQWRPQSKAERLRAAAELAFGMQNQGYQGFQRKRIVISRPEAERLLPKAWERWERRGFLGWLVGAAGVMSDKADDSLTFVHLSFQEFLCAYWWTCTLEGDEKRIELCQRHAANLHWWETLRLWAALVQDNDPEKIRPVFEIMLKGSMKLFWLLGAMLADGTGEEGIFGAWLGGLEKRFHIEEWDEAQQAAQAWRGCKQEERRRKILEAWPKLQDRWTFIQCLVAQNWAEWAGLNVGKADAFEKLRREAGKGQGIGWGRVLSGFNPMWPCEPLEPVLLRLWPTPRREISTRLTCLLMGTQGSFLEQDVSKNLLLISVRNEELERDLARYMVRHLARNLARELARGWARYLAQDFARQFVRDFAHHLALDFARQRVYSSAWLERDSTRSFAQNLTRYLEADWAFEWARAAARHFGLDADSPWIMDVVTIDWGSTFNRFTTRAAFARLEPQHLPSPLHHLFHQACRLSLEPASNPIDFERALAQYRRTPNPEPLWPALARWITRRALPGDRELLLSLAEHPELRQQDSALYHGLKYYVRGDIVLPDNSEQTLDFYCDKLNVTRLSLLEPMPPEIELD